MLSTQLFRPQLVAYSTYHAQMPLSEGFQAINTTLLNGELGRPTENSAGQLGLGQPASRMSPHSEPCWQPDRLHSRWLPRVSPKEELGQSYPALSFANEQMSVLSVCPVVALMTGSCFGVQMTFQLSGSLSVLAAMYWQYSSAQI